MKRIWKEYFSFSKKERIAVIILLLLIACFTLLPYVYKVKRQPPVINKSLLAIAQKMAQPLPDSVAGNSYTETAATNKLSGATLLFPFDPNTLAEEGWMRLGLNPRLIRTILNYRSKGGRFRSAEDIRKIWGLRKEDADRLIPYVQVAVQKEPVPGYKLPVPGNQKPLTGNRILDINTAKAEDWKTLPGIGDKLAARIVNYRERLGGFINLAQVKRTYGISDSVFALISPWLKADPENIPKADLNSVSAYELRQKTDIPAAVAQSIIVYRQQYGPYKLVEDLKKIAFMNDSLFQKIAPFVKVD